MTLSLTNSRLISRQMEPIIFLSLKPYKHECSYTVYRYYGIQIHVLQIMYANNIMLVIKYFHIGSVTGPRPAVFARGQI